MRNNMYEHFRIGCRYRFRRRRLGSRNVNPPIRKRFDMTSWAVFYDLTRWLLLTANNLRVNGAIYSCSRWMHVLVFHPDGTIRKLLIARKMLYRYFGHEISERRCRWKLTEMNCSVIKSWKKTPKTFLSPLPSVSIIGCKMNREIPTKTIILEHFLQILLSIKTVIEGSEE